MRTSATNRRSAPWPVTVGGGIATAAGLGVAALIAALVGTAGPVAAIGATIIDLLPGPVVNFGKDTLGFADKPILLILVTLVALTLGGVAGQLEAHRRNLGWTVIGPVAVVALVAALSRADATPVTAVVPVAVAVAVAVPLLRVLVDRALTWSGDGSTAGTDSSAGGAVLPGNTGARRSFLAWSVGGTATAAAGLAAGAAADGLGGGRTPDPQFPLPTPTARASVPSEVDLGLDGLSPYLTSNDQFYRIDTALVVPRVSADRGQRVVTGMVERTITLDYPQLLARDLVEHVATLACVSNQVGGDLAGNARWLGLPIRELLAEAGPQPGADMVLSRSADGWTAGTPLDVLTDPDRQCLLAVGMNGEPLPRQHGYPVRMVVPGLYGYVSATKWVVELKVTTFAADQGYWTPLGWSARGPVKLASRIDVPRGQVTAGEVVVAGVAWAQHTGIGAVQVRVDGGPWQPAELAETTGPDTWRQWSWRWQAELGEHTVECRAQDADGEWQTEEIAPPAPNGASGLHSRTVPVAMS